MERAFPRNDAGHEGPPIHDDLIKLARGMRRPFAALLGYAIAC